MMVATCFLSLGFSAVAWRLYDLHVKRAPLLCELAAKKFREERTLPAHRGSILDHGGRYLAYDEEVFELRTNRVHLNELPTVKPCLARVRGTSVRELTKNLSDTAILQAYHEHVAQALAAKTGRSHADMLAVIRSDTPVQVLLRKLDDEQAADWRAYLSAMHIKGVYILPAVERQYPAHNRLALVVGGMEEGRGGAFGIEKSCEELLRGIPGSVVIERDKFGRELPLYRGKMQEPEHGRDIHLTLDLPIQDAIDAILSRASQTWKPGKIMAVVTEVTTGSVLAMSFMPNHDRELANKPGATSWKNLAIYEPYEPGSTFKIVAFTAGLDLRKLSPDERIDCHWGHYTDPVFKASLTDLKKMSVVPARDVFTFSSNVGTYKVYKKVGQTAFIDYTRRFGFGSRTGISLPGESAGYFNDGRWSNTTHSRLPMGYEVKVTPLQMALAYGAIANGGLLMKPRLIDRITGADGRVEQVVEPEVAAQVCSGRTAQLMRELLKNVVAKGTGTRAQIEGIEVAGKTGTSQRYDPDLVVGRRKDGSLRKGGYRRDQWITSFAGFAPADDPKIACVVVVDNPKASDPSEIGGGKVAAPIFAEIVRETLRQLSVRPQRPLALQGGAP
jgi:cell division protein FtsI/penicillin-binding protein 2